MSKMLTKTVKVHIHNYLTVNVSQKTLHMVCRDKHRAFYTIASTHARNDTSVTVISAKQRTG